MLAVIKFPKFLGHARGLSVCLSVLSVLSVCPVCLSDPILSCPVLSRPCPCLGRSGLVPGPPCLGPDSARSRPSVYLSVRLLRLSVYLSVRPSVCLSVAVYFCLSLSRSVSVCLCLLLFVSVYLCLSLFVSVFVYLSVVLVVFVLVSVWVCLCLSLFLYLSVWVLSVFYLSKLIKWCRIGLFHALGPLELRTLARFFLKICIFLVV